jgi:hypothetical protein
MKSAKAKRVATTKDAMVSEALSRLAKSNSRAEDESAREQLRAVIRTLQSCGQETGLCEGDPHHQEMLRCNERSRAKGWLSGHSQSQGASPAPKVYPFRYRRASTLV